MSSLIRIAGLPAPQRLPLTHVGIHFKEKILGSFSEHEERMNTLLGSLLGDLRSDKKVHSENACFVLALLLEMYTNESCESLVAFDRQLLPPEFQSIKLTDEEHREAVAEIFSLIRARPDGQLGSLIHLLSKGAISVVFEPLITTIHEASRYFAEEDAIQAIFALYDMACRDPDGVLFLKYANLLRKCDIYHFLLKWDTRSVCERVNVKGCIDRVQLAIKQ